MSDARHRSTRAPLAEQCAFEGAKGRCSRWKMRGADVCAVHTPDALSVKLVSLIEQRSELDAEIAAMRRNMPIFERRRA